MIRILYRRALLGFLSVLLATGCTSQASTEVTPTPAAEPTSDIASRLEQRTPEDVIEVVVSDVEEAIQ